MTTKELFGIYRTTILEIEELEQQLEQVTPTGAPSAGHGSAMTEHRSVSNDPMAAALQLADGLEAMIRRKQELLEDMKPAICHALTAITNGRVLQIVQGYYLLAQTDEQIGHGLGLSTTRINQIRNRYIRSAS